MNYFLMNYVCPTGTEPKDDRTRLFAMYHRRTHKQVKDTVEREFCKADGTVRVVFCTVAFGMGVDVKGAQLAIYLGPSSALDDYLQECGRIGRDTTQMSHAVLLKYKGCTGSKNISKTMRAYVKNTTECRRIILMKEFSNNPKKGDIGHNCCDICSKNCKCKCLCSTPDCNCSEQCPVDQYVSPIASHLSNMNAAENKNIDAKVKKMVSKHISCEVRRQLLQYRTKLANNIPHEKLLTGLDLATGFSRALIEGVISSLHLIDSYESLEKNFNFLSDEHAKHTWNIIFKSVTVYSDSEDDGDSNPTYSSDECSRDDTDTTGSGSDDEDINRYNRVQRICIETCSEDEHSS